MSTAASDIAVRFHAAHAAPRFIDRLAIARGTWADYLALAPHHYAAGPPATRVLVLRAADAGRLVGVLVVSMPTLNAAWRRAAWPGRLEGLTRPAAARWVNENLRTISRVIVEPRYRGCGIASSLVRAYLDDPLTPFTEAVAAMAASCRFFEAAGMRRVERPPSPFDAALSRRIARCGLKPWQLLDLARARAACERSRELRLALRRWAVASGRGTKRLLDGPIALTAACAGSRLTARGVVLVSP